MIYIKKKILLDLFCKAGGAEREIVGENKYASRRPNPMAGTTLMMNETNWDCTKDLTITAPATEMAKQWDGWKTAGLKPAHEPITIFQKPLDGIYIKSIETHGCGGMNISACRVPTSDNLNGAHIQVERGATLFPFCVDHTLEVIE